MSLISESRSVPDDMNRLCKLDLLRRQVAFRGCSTAAWPESAGCSAACAARATCWPGIPTCTSSESDSCAAFSSSALPRLFDLGVLLLDLAVLLRQQRSLLFQLLVDLLQLFLLLLEQLLGSLERARLRFQLDVRAAQLFLLLPELLGLDCSSPVNACDCWSSSSVRMFAAIMFSTTPTLSAS